MYTSVDYKLKKGFRDLFPAYARQLDSAKSQEEISKLHQGFLLETKQNLANVLGKKVEELDVADYSAPFPLKIDQYESLINARGNAIKARLQTIIDGMQDLNGMKGDDDTGLATAQLLLSGALGLGKISSEKSLGSIVSGATASAAAYAGVSVATVAVVAAIAAVVIVAIIVPLIYYMQKPANCLVLLINELDKPLVFKEDYNEHGKPMLVTSPLPTAVVIPKVGTYATAGFISTEKAENALVGTQYGFAMEYDGIDLAFGVECPLTGIYEDNNCFCAIGETAKNAAIKTQKENKQAYTASSGGINLSIYCNSGAGSVAYYVARAYKA